MSKTFDGLTYQQRIDTLNSRFTYYHTMFLDSVNYAFAIIQEPERFSTSAGEIANILKYWKEEYQITINPYRYISDDDVLMAFQEAANSTRVQDIIARTSEYQPPKYKIEEALNHSLCGLFGMGEVLEAREGLKNLLARNAFHENDVCLQTKELYERTYLKKEGRIADLFFSGGGLSHSSINVKVSNLNFRNVPNLGYMSFSMNRTQRCATLSEVFCQGTFSGLSQLSLRGVFITANDGVFQGSAFPVKKWVLSKDKKCGVGLTIDMATGNKFIFVHYCRLLPEGVHEFQDYFNEFKYQARQVLKDGGVNVSW